MESIFTIAKIIVGIFGVLAFVFLFAVAALVVYLDRNPPEDW